MGPGNQFTYGGVPGEGTIAAHEEKLMTVDSDRGSRFVYRLVPGTGPELIASHCPAGPVTDSYGNQCPAGDWCSREYGLVRMTEVWPGVMLRKMT